MFSDCHSACPQVCGEEPQLICTKDCIEGCGCPKGLVRSFRNSTTCVKEDDCKGNILYAPFIAKVNITSDT